MGVLNVTPDSFSDGGRFDDPARAVAQGIAMAREGAEVIDVGGESTRPGHVPVDAQEETRRVLPVVEALAGRIDVPISIDTTKAEVAEAAIAAGAAIVNDVWGLRKDPRLAEVAARHGCGLVLMHNRTEIDPSIDIVEDVAVFLEGSVAAATAAGVPRERIVLDPGVGFGKTQEQNLETVRAAAALRDRLGLPLLFGVSRKSFIGRVTGRERTDDRLAGTVAVGTLLMAAGVEWLRVHDVAAHVDAARMVAALAGPAAGTEPPD